MKYIVRHGIMRHLGEFEPREGVNCARGMDVIIRSDRGHEVGEVLFPSSEQAVAMISDATHGSILRELTPDDRSVIDRLYKNEQREFEVCQRFIKSRKLQMELVNVEHLFGGERVLFFFLAEKRVDFRELVKDLARECQTRIEMRQIGVRDEAKLLADYGDCGKPVCCNTHMPHMPPVSMRMAKLQKSTLDPTKISGRCGRLKCCLRFEHEVYEEFQKQLPPNGSRIVTDKGQGRVLAQEILARKLLVQFEDGRRVLITADEVLTRL